ncbi:MAG: YraN family protein [Candidatus Aminicenantes bacterium]|nr:YraN family protein [Candidatus Aminicenantes bacterium]
MRNKQTPHDLGKLGEKTALNYLIDNKYKIVTRGFRLFRGEIDIIAYDQKTLVFVEVKARRSTDYGFPEESVTPSKQRQIRKIAEGFMAKNSLQDLECRFDVISLSFDEKEGYSIRHFKDAF